MSKENNPELSIAVELLAEITNKLTLMEKRIEKLENGNRLSLSNIVDTEGDKEVEHRRSPSLSNIGLKVEEGNLENSGEDRIKQIIKHCSEVILESAPDYITNK